MFLLGEDKNKILYESWTVFLSFSSLEKFLNHIWDISVYIQQTRLSHLIRESFYFLMTLSFFLYDLKYRVTYFNTVSWWWKELFPLFSQIIFFSNLHHEIVLNSDPPAVWIPLPGTVWQLGPPWFGVSPVVVHALQEVSLAIFSLPPVVLLSPDEVKWAIVAHVRTWKTLAGKAFNLNSWNLTFLSVKPKSYSTENYRESE